MFDPMSNCGSTVVRSERVIIAELSLKGSTQYEQLPQCFLRQRPDRAKLRDDLVVTLQWKERVTKCRSIASRSCARRLGRYMLSCADSMPK